MKRLSRRQFIRVILILFGAVFVKQLVSGEQAALSEMLKSLGMSPAKRELDVALAAPLAPENAGPGNFKKIYLDAKLRDRFFLFLQNIYRIYPETDFHALITAASQTHLTDKEIYEEVQRRLPAIKPFLADLTYGLPALRTQKAEMARQTATLLSGLKSVKGYVEIGTTGRYVEPISNYVKLRGKITIVNELEPRYSLVDMMERGRVLKVGRFVAMNNYASLPANALPDESVELVTNFIGFHHAPKDKLDGFVTSIARVLKPGGKLIVRDHDVDSDEMDAFVALAHDVFNAGLNVSWQDNAAEIRHFRSLKGLEDYLKARGFAASGPRLLQDGDPTKNTLLEFVKVM